MGGARGFNLGVEAAAMSSDVDELKVRFFNYFEEGVAPTLAIMYALARPGEARRGPRRRAAVLGSCRPKSDCLKTAQRLETSQQKPKAAQPKM